jgi:hypothetical protein
MADFVTAYNWMLDNEDRGRQYKMVPDAPPGAFAISGINSFAYPSQFAAINVIPQAQRGPVVQNFYQLQFWNQWFQQLLSDDVAKRVFDSAVNMGPGTAVKVLQTAVNQIVTTPIAVDGGWGPNTLASANSCVPLALVAQFQQARLAHYQAIVAANPADAQYLGTQKSPGPWWMRAIQ